MDKQLLRDAQLKLADARSLVQGVLDDYEERMTEIPENKGGILEEILETFDALDQSIEKLIAEQEPA